jgi:hypothetical protein
LELGSDGTKGCYPPMMPHRNKIRLPARKSVVGRDEDMVSCDNHIQHYLNKGWELVSKLCQYCCVAEASADDSCEDCLDKMTTPLSDATRLKIKESGFCLNRDNVHGCCAYAEPGTQYCPYCRTQNLMLPKDRENMGKRHIPLPDALPGEPRPKIRTIPTSTRNCKLTPACAGSMTASVQIRANELGPQLWWSCSVCRVSQKASRTQSKPSSKSLLPLLGDVYGPAPINAELADQAEHMRSILNDSESE